MKLIITVIASICFIAIMVIFWLDLAFYGDCGVKKWIRNLLWGMLIICSCIGIYMDSQVNRIPSALDVYRGKTQLIIKDNDSVVIYKNTHYNKLVKLWYKL